MLAVGACGGPAPTPSPTPAPSLSPTPAPSPSPTPGPSGPAGSDTDNALFARIEGQVVAIRGLQPKAPVGRRTLDPAALRKLITTNFHQDNPDQLVRDTESLYKALLLLPADASLADDWTDLMASQVVGMYDDKTKTMYVVSSTGSIGPAEEITYAHEYTHALQDQAFDLEHVMGTETDQGDRSIARRMLVEGDATLLMSLWARANLTPAELAAAAGASDPTSQAILDRMPAILKEPLLAQYTTGLTLALRTFATGGYGAVDGLFANPPDSTEQVLHADKLTPREPPVAVSLPADLASQLGTGWSVPLQDTLGELQLMVLLEDAGGLDAAAATVAAAGWGGDRIALVAGPAGATGIVLRTAWDTARDADEFRTALGSLVTRLEAAGRAASVGGQGSDIILSVGDSPATLAALTGVGFPAGG